MKITCLTIIITFLMFAAPLTYGEEYYITGTVDISGGYNNGHAGDMFGSINPSSIYLNVDDVVNFRYMFAKGQKIRLADTPDGDESWTRVTAWMGQAVGQEGVYIIDDWTIDLIGATSGSGNVPTSFSSEDQQGDCCIMIGPEASFYMEDGDFLEFYGVSATFTVTSVPVQFSFYNSVQARFNADNISAVPSDIFFPEMTVGGGWSTLFSLYNTGPIPTNGTLFLKDQQGNPLTVSSSELGVGSSFPISMPPGGTMFLTLDLPNPDDTGKSGWALAEYEGGILSGVASYKYSSEGVVTALAGVLPALPLQFATIPVDQDTLQERLTAYAIANPTNQNLMLEICLVDTTGYVFENPIIIELAPGEQLAKYLWQDLFLPEFKGTIVLKAQGAGVFVAVGLMQNQDLFTVTPVEAGITPEIPF